MPLLPQGALCREQLLNQYFSRLFIFPFFVCSVQEPLWVVETGSFQSFATHLARHTQARRSSSPILDFSIKI